jgi:hypothetical protein
MKTALRLAAAFAASAALGAGLAWRFGHGSLYADAVCLAATSVVGTAYGWWLIRGCSVRSGRLVMVLCMAIATSWTVYNLTSAPARHLPLLAFGSALTVAVLALGTHYLWVNREVA